MEIRELMGEFSCSAGYWLTAIHDAERDKSWYYGHFIDWREVWKQKLADSERQKIARAYEQWHEPRGFSGESERLEQRTHSRYLWWGSDLEPWHRQRIGLPPTQSPLLSKMNPERVSLATAP